MSANERRLVVEPAETGWRVTGERDGPAFARRETATEWACAQARRAAEAGQVSLVVVRSEPQELHCYTPGVDRA